MRKKLKLLAVFLGWLSILSASQASWAKVYVSEPLLVPQPSYAGMRFYVYRPYDMPKNWYATFDGYPVTKNKDGVWVYGTYSGPNLIPTHYIVGSVVPSMAGLSPYARSVRISSVTSVPQAVSVQQPAPAVRAAAGAHSTYVPDWLFNPRFVALGNWKSSIDRIGILHRPAVPVAWRGSTPRVLYAWNGRSWYQMTARENERPVDVLKNQLYSLTRMVNGNGFTWYEADTPVLAQQAAQWGFYWMGEVAPER